MKRISTISVLLLLCMMPSNLCLAKLGVVGREAQTLPDDEVAAVDQHNRMLDAPDEEILCLKTKDKKNAGSVATIRLMGIRVDNDNGDYEYSCTLDGIGRDEEKCCVAQKREANYLLIDPFTDKTKGMKVKLKNNENDGLKITRLKFGGKKWEDFSGSTSFCTSILFDGCINWPNCSTCTRNDCLRIDEPWFILDGNRGPKCIEAIIQSDGTVCCNEMGR